MAIVKNLRDQKGVTIIAVFFVLLILGAMGMAVSKLTQSQQLQSAKAIQVQNAYYNARSGMEWAYQYAIDAGLLESNLATLWPSTGTEYTLPNQMKFKLIYDSATKDLTSTSTVGDSVREVKWTNFGGTGNNGPFDNGGGGGNANNHNCYIGTISDQLPGLFGEEGGVNQNNGGQAVDVPWPSFDENGDKLFGEDWLPTDQNYYDQKFDGADNDILPGPGETELYINKFETEDDANITIDAEQAGGPLTVYSQSAQDFDIKDDSTLTINGPVTMHIGDDFDCKNNATVNLNGPITIFVYDEVTFSNNCNINITGAVNIIVNSQGSENAVTIKNNAAVNVAEGSSLLIMAEQDFNMEDNASITSDGDSSNILLVTNDDFRAKNNNIIEAGIYAKEELEFENNVIFSGAASTGEGINIESGVTINEEETAGQSIYGDPDTRDCSQGYQ